MTESSASSETSNERPSSAWMAGLREDYERIFVQEWSPYLGAVFLVMIAAALMTSGLFWGVFGGLKLWGDWFNQFIGLGPLLGIKGQLDNPLLQISFPNSRRSTPEAVSRCQTWPLVNQNDGARRRHSRLLRRPRS